MILTVPVHHHSCLSGTHREYGPPDVEFEWNAHDIELRMKLVFAEMGVKVKWTPHEIELLELLLAWS